jgi:hypothetical protein
VRRLPRKYLREDAFIEVPWCPDFELLDAPTAQLDQLAAVPRRTVSDAV